MFFSSSTATHNILMVPPLLPQKIPNYLIIIQPSATLQKARQEAESIMQRRQEREEQ